MPAPGSTALRHLQFDGQQQRPAGTQLERLRQPQRLARTVQAYAAVGEAVHHLQQDAERHRIGVVFAAEEGRTLRRRRQGQVEVQHLSHGGLDVRLAQARFLLAMHLERQTLGERGERSHALLRPLRRVGATVARQQAAQPRQVAGLVRVGHLLEQALIELPQRLRGRPRTFGQGHDDARCVLQDRLVAGSADARREEHDETAGKLGCAGDPVGPRRGNPRCRPAGRHVPQLASGPGSALGVASGSSVVSDFSAASRWLMR
jgi:hypothetical protein